MSARMVAAAAVPAPRPASDTAAPLRLPIWQSQPCPPWCSTDHKDSDYYEDRHHWATPVEAVDLTLYDDIGFEDKPCPSSLDLSIIQHYREAEPTIDLVLPVCESANGRRVAGETTLMLTVDEARVLRDRLSVILTLVDDAGGEA